MSQFRLEAKSKRNSRKPLLNSGNYKDRRREELLKEVDSLALLLDEVRRQSEKIQAAADALGDAVFEVFPPSSRPGLDLNGTRKRDVSMADRLT